MTINILKKIFGSRNERILKKLNHIVSNINSLECKMKSLSDQQIQEKTLEFKQRLIQGETLDDLLPESFALVREVSVRALGLRHFDVQLIGGIVLHKGKIAEMQTGEGKTLAATLPVYLNALSGRPVHVVTVNDYLAKRDATWMSPIYNFLGMNVGVITSNQNQKDKKLSYSKDIVYGTNNEFGFDYLRDNMVFDASEQVQRGLVFAVIDEVDSILIDEARTPLIISGPSENNDDLCTIIDKIVSHLIKLTNNYTSFTVVYENNDIFVIDEKVKQVYLTEHGYQCIEQLCLQFNLINEPKESLYDSKNVTLMRYINAALRAHILFHRDIDYIIKNGEIIIIDEHTGRAMDGRRWSDGLHQAIEAKERVKINIENQTLASITFQNYFRMYEKLSGMTGTADTEAYEFQQVYGLEVVVIPTHKPMIRQDYSDTIYLTAKYKFNAILEDIKTQSRLGRPILVGTTSIETSEKMSNMLGKAGIKHQVLNAKQHEKEASIIAQAGRPGIVTIATNMAGRGTDIVLGGSNISISSNRPISEKLLISNPKNTWQIFHNMVIESGGLYVIGSERHESRRIDNQLRGRAGRQGDPGSSRFYLSLEDNLLRIFASDKISILMQKLGMKETEVIEHHLITKAIENAQRKVESHNFESRKHLLDFDDVSNEQRKVIYKQRELLIQSKDISNIIKSICLDIINKVIDKFTIEYEDFKSLEEYLNCKFKITLPILVWSINDPTLRKTHVKNKIIDSWISIYNHKEVNIGISHMRNVERYVMLQILDNYWKDHLTAMDQMRDGIHLRGYAYQNPKQEYKMEAFRMFTKMLSNIKYDVVRSLYNINPEEVILGNHNIEIIFSNDDKYDII